MMDSDFELGGDSTNPRVESESFIDGSSSENRVDSASVHSIAPSDSSTAVQGVDSVVAEGSVDSVSAEGNVSDVNNRRAGDSNKLGVSESNDKEDVSSDRKHGSVKHIKSAQKKGQRKKESKSKQSTSPVSVYDSMISTFDDFAANGSVATEVRSSMEGPESPGHGFEVGDMVWGKVKSHPWWPGHVFSEEFATASVRRSKREGLLLVAFFGDSSYGWFDPSELMPFESNFAEKSRQTNSKTFVKAVEEAMDELSRRSALGLSCMCRSKQNFRKTNVKGYFAVDVADYEPGAVYSIDAIEKARDSFKPSSALAFIRQLALEPTGVEHDGIDFVKNKANVISYRRAIYEEFDETYAQAFGYSPPQPSQGTVKELPPGKTPFKAPLSGRQVFADTAGKGKNLARANRSKDQAKKDRYLFKRRQESEEAKPHQKEKEKPPFSPQLDHVEDSTTIAAGDYVLQKRPPATHEEVAKTIENNESPSIDDTPVAPESGDPGFPATTIKAESPVTSSAGEIVPDHGGGPGGDDEKKTEDKKVDIPNSGENEPKKVKVLKRPAGELDSGKPISEKKKKRKKESLTSETTDIVEKPVEVSDEIELSRILSDLRSLALDPFQAINKGWTVKTRQGFLRFRSAVFQKSLNSSPPPEDDDGNDPKPVSVKPENSFSGRLDDPTKRGRKRGPSDRQEEMAAKKKKKVGDIRNLTKEKKVTKKVDEPPPPPGAARDVKPPVVTGRWPCPTMLTMRFPTGGSLPSIFELMAKLSRFGPLDRPASRILWKSFACRVVYKYKADAQAAMKAIAGSGGPFGKTDVKCTLKELGEIEAPTKREDHQQLKSCLKKSEGGGSGGRGAARVKFVLAGDESHNKSSGESSSFSSTTTTTSQSTMDVNSKNFQKGVLPIPTSSVSSTVQFTRLPPPPLPLPLPLPLAPPLLPLPPQRSYNYGGDMAAPPLLPLPEKYVHKLERPNMGHKVDISEQMLSLLRKCNEVVTNVTIMLGYVPYHPL